MTEKLKSDRLKDFRNVIFSIRPLLFDLTPTSNFKSFQEACSAMIERARETEGDVAAKLVRTWQEPTEPENTGLLLADNQ